MNPEVAVIINSFNRLVLLKECLPNIIDTLSKIKISYVIVIFDAGSTDGSVEYVNEMNHQLSSLIILITAGLNDNFSFSAGCNRSAKEAVDRYSYLSYLLFFETDNLFKNETSLQQAATLMKEKKEFACVGFTVEKISGEKIVYGNKKPSVLGFIMGQQLGAKLGIEQVKPQWCKSAAGIEYTYTDIVFTSPLLVRTKAW